jgi:hypothetical protein
MTRREKPKKPRTNERQHRLKGSSVSSVSNETIAALAARQHTLYAAVSRAPKNGSFPQIEKCSYRLCLKHLAERYDVHSPTSGNCPLPQPLAAPGSPPTDSPPTSLLTEPLSGEEPDQREKEDASDEIDIRVTSDPRRRG